jgi:phage-related protein
VSRNTIELVLTGRSEGVESAVSGATGALQGLGNVAQVALGTLAGSLMTGAIQKVGELARAIGDTLVNEAPALEQVSRSFENLATSAGASADEVLASMREASNGMVSDADLMTSYNEAMLLVGDSMATQFPALLEIAQASASATGEDVGFMLDSLVKGIGRASPMILDNLGLTISTAEAYGQYAEQLGISTDEMSKAQQQEALLNAVVAQGGDFVERLGDNTGGAAQTMGQMRATLDNLRNGLATALLPALVAILEPLGGLAQEYGPRVVAWAEQAGQWLGAHIPGALATLQAVWATAWPQIQAAVDAVWPVVQQVFAQVATWLQDEGPAALATLQALWATAWPQIQAALQTIWPVVQAIFTQVSAWLQNDGPTALGQFRDVWQQIWSRVQAILTTVSAFIQERLNVLRGWWQAHGSSVRTIVDAMMQAIQAVITFVLSNVQAFWNAWGDEIIALTQLAWDTVGAIVDGVLAAIGALVDAFAAALTGDWEAFGEHIATFWGTVWETIGTVVENGAAALIEIVTGLIDNIRTSWNNVDWGELGRSVINGIAGAISAGAGAIASAARGAAQAALDAAKNLLGISSPSKVFAALGENVVMSFADRMRALSDVPAQAAGQMAQQTVQSAVDRSDRSVTIYGGVTQVVREGNGGLLAELQGMTV